MRTPPRSVLVVVTRRIGDVLLATPVIRSVKQAWPQAAIDAVVIKGTEGVIADTPDLRRVLAVPQRPGVRAHLRFIRDLLRRYDVALSILPSDRSTIYAFLGGRWRAGLHSPTRKEAWKQLLLHEWRLFDNVNTHTVAMDLALAEMVGVPRNGEVVVSWSAEDEQRAAQLLGGDAHKPLAVLHACPKFNYKMWRPEGWVEVARWLAARDFRVALTGSGDADELAYVNAVAREMPAGTINAAGRLTLGGSACLVSRARIYVGPDTAMTHIAAALGVPTAAIYGPTNPVKWGPWPRGHAPDANPWRRCGSQRNGNVLLVQGTGTCVPCHQEGCERNIASFSDCLLGLPPARVIAAVEQLLATA
ncbi:MAG: glycosyltransferase family 9 protein [Burkholderiales bacterium]